MSGSRTVTTTIDWWIPTVSVGHCCQLALYIETKRKEEEKMKNVTLTVRVTQLH